jgi:hypothetical protein
MLILDAEHRTRQSIIDHYDALSVELLGARASGLTRERIEALVRSGRLSADQLQGLDVADLSEPTNPILFTRLIGTPYSRANPEERARMRSMSLEEWGRRLRGVDQRTPSAAPSQRLFTRSPSPFSAPLPPHPLAIPEYFTPAERAGLVSSFEVAGSYIRGLGARFADEASAELYEEWGGERLLQTPDPQKRARMLKVIREEVGTATLTKDQARTVARRIRQRSGDLARNFERIAETELQAVHNEGQIAQAVDLDGESARVARIPESGACGYCLRAFIDPETQRPYIFEVSQLIENGSNIGRKRADWTPSAYPMHPSCRCDTIPVGPDQTVSRSGRIQKEVSNED